MCDMLPVAGTDVHAYIYVSNFSFRHMRLIGMQCMLTFPMCLTDIFPHQNTTFSSCVSAIHYLIIINVHLL